MSYVDGFVLPVPKKSLAAHRRMAMPLGINRMVHGGFDVLVDV